MGLTGWGCVVGVLGRDWQQRHWRSAFVQKGDGATVGLELFGEIHKVLNVVDKSKAIRRNFAEHITGSGAVDVQSLLLIAEQVYTAIERVASIAAGVIVVAEGTNPMKLRGSGTSVPDCLVEEIRRRIKKTAPCTVLCSTLRSRRAACLFAGD